MRAHFEILDALKRHDGSGGVDLEFASSQDIDRLEALMSARPVDEAAVAEVQARIGRRTELGIRGSDLPGARERLARGQGPRTDLGFGDCFYGGVRWSWEVMDVPGCRCVAEVLDDPRAVDCESVLRLAQDLHAERLRARMAENARHADIERLREGASPEPRVGLAQRAQAARKLRTGAGSRSPDATVIEPSAAPVEEIPPSKPEPKPRSPFRSSGSGGPVSPRAWLSQKSRGSESVDGKVF